MEIDLGASYRHAREDVAELVRSLGSGQLQAPVPTCPGWSVHDVVSHLAGMATDAVNNRLNGPPSDEQTAAQVRERASTPTSIVLREWERTASQYEVVLSKSSAANPASVIGVAVHEHDIRGALGLPGNREAELVGFAVERAARLWLGKVDSAGLAPVRAGDGTLIAGEDAAPVHLRAGEFEFFRVVYGRRSRAQIERRFSGVGDAGPYIDLLCLSEPASSDIVE